MPCSAPTTRRTGRRRLDAFRLTLTNIRYCPPSTTKNSSLPGRPDIRGCARRTEPESRHERPGAITPDLVAAHGLKPDEYQRILDLIGREPTLTELGIFSAMWNEHCSYKSSKNWLRTLPTTGPRVIYGPGENAGVVDIGDGLAVDLQDGEPQPPLLHRALPGRGDRRRRHPPRRLHHGRAADRGAERAPLRRARPPEDPPSRLRRRRRHRRLRQRLRRADRRRRGQLPPRLQRQHPRQRLRRRHRPRPTRSSTRRPPASACRSSISAPRPAATASTARRWPRPSSTRHSSEKRPTVQVGDPFSEKLLLEACLELMATGAVVAIQDMGAAGLTSSAVEMGAKGDLGIELDLDKVPCRETGMTAYEMMLSESQERMLMVLRPEKAGRGRGDLPQVGARLRRRRPHHRRPPLPHHPQGQGRGRPADQGPRRPGAGIRPPVHAPERPRRRSTRVGARTRATGTPALLQILGAPDMCSRRWVWEQYDHLIGGNTMQRPGGDAAVVRIDGTPEGPRLLARRDAALLRRRPFRGRQAGGRRMLAQPHRRRRRAARRHRQPQFRQSRAAGDHGRAGRRASRASARPAAPSTSRSCRATSRSTTRPTARRSRRPRRSAASASCPTSARWRRSPSRPRARRSSLVGAPRVLGTHLGQSIYLREILGREDGPPPPVDLAHEKRVGDFVRGLIRDRPSPPPSTTAPTAASPSRSPRWRWPAASAPTSTCRPAPRHSPRLFGEDQGRYVVTARAGDRSDCRRRRRNGRRSRPSIGTDRRRRFETRHRSLSISVAKLREAHENWFPAFHGRGLTRLRQIEPAWR